MAHVIALPKTNEKTDHANAAAIAQELGLVVQAHRYSTPYMIERDFTPLTEDEELVWRSFCPTAYRSEWTDQTQNATVRNIFEYRWGLAHYTNDTIPAEVLHHWGEIKKKYAFDAYEVRTTERRARDTDPLLIGYFSNKMYLLARWGLESPEALPLRAVARAVMKEREEERGSSTFLWSTTHYWESDRIWQAASRVATA